VSRKESLTKGSYWESVEVAAKFTEEDTRGKGAHLGLVVGRISWRYSWEDETYRRLQVNRTEDTPPLENVEPVTMRLGGPRSLSI
jgi:hypothetical protein